MESLYNWMLGMGLDPALLPYIAGGLALVLVIALYVFLKPSPQADAQTQDESVVPPAPPAPARPAEKAETLPEVQDLVSQEKIAAAPLEPETSVQAEVAAESTSRLAEVEVVIPATPVTEVRQDVTATDAAFADSATLETSAAVAPARELEIPAVEAEVAEAPSETKQFEPATPVPSAPEAPVEPAVAAPVVTAAPSEAPEQRKQRLFERIRSGLSRTKASLTTQIGELFGSSQSIDEDLLEELETLLLMADVGVEATTAIIGRLNEAVEKNELKDPAALQQALKRELSVLLQPVQQPLNLVSGQGTQVILVVGVNGVGKTTTIGKLAKRLQAEGKSVMLAAGDTFRAAAVEQLQVWGERNQVPVVAQHTGADSASVIFDALQSAQAKGIDVLIADTAGRLQNKDNLMNELSKVVRVMKKLDPQAPHEVMLVLDAGTGQNAISQAKQFREAVGVTGITLTKLDGTAKGGIIFAIAKQFELPIRFIGVGEQIDDLRPFSADEFVQALFD